MKRLIKGIFAGALVAVCAICAVGCGNGSAKAKPIDNSVYFSDEVFRKTYSTGVTQTSMSLSQNLLGEDGNAWQYTSIQIKGQKKWICSMTISKIDFVFEATHDTSLDLTLTITNVCKTDNFNKTEDLYYYESKTPLALKAGESQLISFIVEDRINATKAPTVTLTIEEECYKNNADLLITLKEFNVYGEHIVTKSGSVSGSVAAK